MPQLKNLPKDTGIFRVATYGPGNLLIDFPIEESEDVILHCGDYSVIVRNIKKASESKFTGTVLGIEPPGAKLDDVKAGDVVYFTESQVISASKGDY